LISDTLTLKSTELADSYNGARTAHEGLAYLVGITNLQFAYLKVFGRGLYCTVAAHNKQASNLSLLL